MPIKKEGSYMIAHNICSWIGRANPGRFSGFEVFNASNATRKNCPTSVTHGCHNQPPYKL